MKSKFLACASALAVACAFASTARAADVPPFFKAPRQNFSRDVYNTSGWFLTVGTSAGVAQSSIGANNLFASSLVGGNLVADGAGVLGGFGYVSYGGPTGWWMFRNYLTYQNVSGGVAAGSIHSNWSVTQEACVGVEFLQNLAAILPNISSAFPTFVPVAPLGATGTPRQCIGGVSREYQLGGSIGAAQGETWGWEPGAAIHFIWEGVDKNGKQTGGAWDVSLLFADAMRGVTFGDVFAKNGAPLTIGPGANIGRQYEVSLSYHFSPYGFAASPPGK